VVAQAADGEHKVAISLRAPSSGAVGLGVSAGSARLKDVCVLVDIPLGDRRSYFHHGSPRVAVRKAW
jgi:hypothetical protein